VDDLRSLAADADQERRESPNKRLRKPFIEGARRTRDNASGEG